MSNLPKSQTELIKKEINRLHERGSGNWQSLTKQVLQNYKPIKYNFPQMVAAHATQKYKQVDLEWARGTGKTTFLGHHIRSCTQDMPRSNGMMIGPTYQSILTQILPSAILGLEQQGLFQGLHYFIGRKPPKNWNWPTAYQPPSKSYDNYISFYWGSGINLISHDKTADGSGLNTDYEIREEAALLDKTKLDAATTPTLRGSNKLAFQKSKYFGSVLGVSSTPMTLAGKWFTDRQELAMLDPENMFFLRADSSLNKHNLRDGYLEEAMKTTLPLIYNAQFLNIRPRFVKGGFYPLLNSDQHTYDSFSYTHYHKVGQEVDCRGDRDLEAGLPLTLGIDFGAAINCMVTCQEVGREFRALKSDYVLGDNQEVLPDLIEKWHSYYQYHMASNSTIYLYYDSTGNNQNGLFKKTAAQIVVDILRSKGWKVQKMTVGGRNPYHAEKHVLWNAILKGDNTRLPRFMMNKSNCKDLWISMFHAKAKTGRNGEIQKDKSSERSEKIDRQHATDLSDAIDTPIYGMYYKIFKGYGMVYPSTRVITS